MNDSTKELLAEHAELMNKYWPDLGPADEFVRLHQQHEEFVVMAHIAKKLKIALKKIQKGR